MQDLCLITNPKTNKQVSLFKQIGTNLYKQYKAKQLKLSSNDIKTVKKFEAYSKQIEKNDLNFKITNPKTNKQVSLLKKIGKDIYKQYKDKKLKLSSNDIKIVKKFEAHIKSGGFRILSGLIEGNELYKYIAIYSSTINDRNIYDFNEGSVQWIVQVVRDVLKYAFNEPEPTPNQILRIIRNAEEWFENAQVGDYNSGNESDYSGNESDNDDDDRDKIVIAALKSGPNLQIISEIPCNESDIPQEPYPILGTFEYTDTQILNAAV